MYGLSWGWEADFLHILSHERDVGEKEFRRMCEDSIKEAIEWLLKRKQRVWFA